MKRTERAEEWELRDQDIGYDRNVVINEKIPCLWVRFNCFFFFFSHMYLAIIPRRLFFSPQILGDGYGPFRIVRNMKTCCISVSYCVLVHNIYYIVLMRQRLDLEK